MIYTEPLIYEAIVSIEVDLTGDENSEVVFSELIDGPVLQLAGNGVDIAIKLDVDHLEKIVNQLAEWGYVYKGKDEEPIDF